MLRRPRKSVQQRLISVQSAGRFNSAGRNITMFIKRQKRVFIKQKR